jgi:hypothetical protein
MNGAHGAPVACLGRPVGLGWNVWLRVGAATAWFVMTAFLFYTRFLSGLGQPVLPRFCSVRQPAPRRRVVSFRGNRSHCSRIKSHRNSSGNATETSCECSSSQSELTGRKRASGSSPSLVTSGSIWKEAAYPTRPCPWRIVISGNHRACVTS